MRATTVVTLPEPVKIGEGTRRTLTLREPTYGDYMRIGGVPAGYAQSGGTAAEYVDYAKLRAYLDACVIDEDAEVLLVLPDTGIANARAVEAALFGFFRPASSTPPVSSPTSSSSDSAGSPST